jgi:hypothetical protein
MNQTQMVTTKWISNYGGREYRLTSIGLEAKDVGYLRTKGAPATMIRLWEDYGDSILHASQILSCPVDMIAAMIPIEATRLPSGSFNPRSDRKEPGYVSDVQTPHRRSPGLMQTLISTAKSMASSYQLVDPQEVTKDLLFDPYYSILLGSAYIRHQIDRYGVDPVKICGAYNAGSVKRDLGNPWHVLSYGKTRNDRFVAWFNDFHAAIQSQEIVLPTGTITSLPMPSTLEELTS